MSTPKSPNDVFSDCASAICSLGIDDMPKLCWKLSSPEISDDETDVQSTGNGKVEQEYKCSASHEANNTTSPHKNMYGGFSNYQRKLEDNIPHSITSSDFHKKTHNVGDDTLMDIEISLSPTLLKENGCTDTWDNIINTVLAEDRECSQISTDIFPQIDKEILTFLTDEKPGAEQTYCKINKSHEQKQFSVEKVPQPAKSNLVPSSSKCNDQLEDLFENESEMISERLSQTLIISPQASQSEFQSDSLAVLAHIQKLQNQVSPKKTAKYVISQPNGRGKNMKKLLSSLNRHKKKKIKPKKEQAKKTPVARSKNNQISYDRKYRRHNPSICNNFTSGYMLRAAQQKDPDAALNFHKEASQTKDMVNLKVDVSLARKFSMKNHERRGKSLQQRVRNRVSDLKEELFLWVSGKCQMTLAQMRRIFVEAKAAKELCTTLLFEAKSAIKQKEFQEIQRTCDWLASQILKAMQESTINHYCSIHPAAAVKQVFQLLVHHLQNFIHPPVKK